MSAVTAAVLTVNPAARRNKVENSLVFGICRLHLNRGFRVGKSGYFVAGVVVCDCRIIIPFRRSVGYFRKGMKSFGVSPVSYIVLYGVKGGAFAVCVSRIIAAERSEPSEIKASERVFLSVSVRPSAACRRTAVRTVGVAVRISVLVLLRCFSAFYLFVSGVYLAHLFCGFRVVRV